ncbi:hypothetical protein [Paenibacillus humicola]|uniref:hypothetical protein n=1 Tax=Paenibacillus humicola TaxID=3110540 RepID=UPI00237AF287|nr:hypothetical protein [Paenibacillus humicola]
MSSGEQRKQELDIRAIMASLGIDAGKLKPDEAADHEAAGAERPADRSGKQAES